MRSRSGSFASARIILGLVSTLALAACDRAITEPGTARALRPSDQVAHDDTPPDFPCRSGWTQTDGRWTCSDFGG